MRAGDLRTFITITRITRTPDGMGGWVESEEVLMNTWAKIDIPKVRLSQVAQQDVEVADYEVTIRYMHGVKPKAGDVIEANGERLKILGVRHDAKERWFVMSCATEVK